MRILFKGEPMGGFIIGEAGPAGFEPTTLGLKARCFRPDDYLPELRARFESFIQEAFNLVGNCFPNGVASMKTDYEEICRIQQ